MVRLCLQTRVVGGDDGASEWSAEQEVEMSNWGYRREAEIEMYESTAGGLELSNRRRPSARSGGQIWAFENVCHHSVVSPQQQLSGDQSKWKGEEIHVSSQDSARNENIGPGVSWLASASLQIMSSNATSFRLKQALSDAPFSLDLNETRYLITIMILQLPLW